MAYVWVWRFTHPLFWIPVVGLILASQLARGDRAASLGLQIENFGACARRFGPALIGVSLAMLAAGLVLGTPPRSDSGQVMLSFGLYLPVGLFQQYLLIGYFLTRFEAVPSRGGGRDFKFTAALFSVVHSPNWFLMLVTPVKAAYAAILECIASRRISTFLGIGAHGTIGTLLFLVVTDSVSHQFAGWPRLVPAIPEQLPVGPTPGQSQGESGKIFDKGMKRRWSSLSLCRGGKLSALSGRFLIGTSARVGLAAFQHL